MALSRRKKSVEAAVVETAAAVPTAPAEPAKARRHRTSKKTQSAWRTAVDAASTTLTWATGTLIAFSVLGAAILKPIAKPATKAPAAIAKVEKAPVAKVAKDTVPLPPQRPKTKVTKKGEKVQVAEELRNGLTI